MRADRVNDASAGERIEGFRKNINGILHHVVTLAITPNLAIDHDAHPVQATLTVFGEYKPLADSKERIARQRDTVAQLKRSGEDARLAERLLVAFIDLEAQHIEQRDKLRLALMKR